MSKNVKGLEKLISVLQKIPDELEREVDGLVFLNAQAIEEDAKNHAPVGTPESTGIKGYIGGSLKQGIRAIRIGKLRVSIKTNITGNAPYSAYVEYGTHKMRAQPYLFPAFFRGRKRFIKDLEHLLKETFNKV